MITQFYDNTVTCFTGLHVSSILDFIYNYNRLTVVKNRFNIHMSKQIKVLKYTNIHTSNYKVTRKVSNVGKKYLFCKSLFELV